MWFQDLRIYYTFVVAKNKATKQFPSAAMWLTFDRYKGFNLMFNCTRCYLLWFQLIKVINTDRKVLARRRFEAMSSSYCFGTRHDSKPRNSARERECMRKEGAKAATTSCKHLFANKSLWKARWWTELLFHFFFFFFVLRGSTFLMFMPFRSSFGIVLVLRQVAQAISIANGQIIWTKWHVRHTIFQMNLIYSMFIALGVLFVLASVICCNKLQRMRSMNCQIVKARRATKASTNSGLIVVQQLDAHIFSMIFEQHSFLVTFCIM